MIRPWMMKKLGYVSVYPTAQSDTYVKATTKASTLYWPYFATDPLLSLTGAEASNSWFSANGSVTNQRFHIDLGSGKVVTRIYYENGHASGILTNAGAQNFTFWGSADDANGAAAFAELTYATDTNWTQLTIAQSTFDQHAVADAVDPKYITVTNSTVYRYCAFKFADNYGNANYIAVRRVELQVLY